MSSEKINCLKCKYYFTTWQPRFPRGCKLFGFKSAQMPSAAVLKLDGEPCKGFTPKDSRNI